MPAATKRKPAPRDREATEAKLKAAVGALLARDGFASLGVRAVAREAQVDPMLVGRYFGGLPGLLDAYAASAAHWPSVAEVTENGAIAGLPLDQRLARILANFAEALARRPVTCEILAWEAAQRSELTDALDRARVAWAEAIVPQYLPELREPGARATDANALLALLGAAVHYIAVRNRHADQDWAGLGVRNAPGRARLIAALTIVCTAVLAGPPPQTRKRK
ncbi:MAG: TetR/AcrR family transcriptional regulator [Alphaproteobacteria bacterium]|nr:TetR/AcrR family transcriptional regulator [Alphaproteobacteria bacterium]